MSSVIAVEACPSCDATLFADHPAFIAAVANAWRRLCAEMCLPRIRRPALVISRETDSRPRASHLRSQKGSEKPSRPAVSVSFRAHAPVVAVGHLHALKANPCKARRGASYSVRRYVQFLWPVEYFAYLCEELNGAKRLL
jgi:hypothetical protein